MNKKHILVTGANGFLGKALIKNLCQKGYQVRAAIRSEKALAMLADYKKALNLEKLTFIQVGELSKDTDWKSALKDVDTVIHCAARAHVLKETNADPKDAFAQVNYHATENLAQQAKALQVKRFIFISSIGVLGSYSQSMPFSELSPANYDSYYGQTKWEAEQRLKSIADKMETVIIRPPLVYGQGVKGNFEKLVKLIQKNIPLPLGSVKNRRNFIGIDNLIDFIITCIEHPAAANETFVVADSETVSTTEFIKNIALAMQKKHKLIAIPHAFLTWGLQLFGKSKISNQLLGNLEINTSKAKDILGWQAPYSMKEQLERIFSNNVIEE